MNGVKVRANKKYSTYTLEDDDSFSHKAIVDPLYDCVLYSVNSVKNSIFPFAKLSP